MQLGYNKRLARKLYSVTQRFAGGHGHHYHRDEFVSKSSGVKYQYPTEKEDLYEHYGKMPAKDAFVFGKIAAYFRLNRDYLDNLRTNKYSAYYWIPRIGFLRNSLFLQTLGYLIDSPKVKSTNSYDEPIKIHENSVFLYKSNRASSYLSFRLYDYVALTALVGFIINPYPMLWLPVITYLVEFPRNQQIMSLYTLRADLLPHTEEVVFTKSTFFGETVQSLVNIRDLQKVGPDAVQAGEFLFRHNTYDPNFVWRDNLTGEIFVFDSDGIWNKEGIDHPLLN